MNKIRRKSLKEISDRMSELHEAIEDVKEQLHSVIDEEQEAYDNMPEGLQESERGQMMEGYIDSMQEVYDSLDELDLSDMSTSLLDIVEG